MNGGRRLGGTLYIFRVFYFRLNLFVFYFRLNIKVEPIYFVSQINDSIDFQRCSMLVCVIIVYWLSQNKREYCHYVTTLINVSS